MSIKQSLIEEIIDTTRRECRIEYLVVALTGPFELRKEIKTVEKILTRLNCIVIPLHIDFRIKKYTKDSFILNRKKIDMCNLLFVVNERDIINVHVLDDILYGIAWDRNRYLGCSFTEPYNRCLGDDIDIIYRKCMEERYED